MIYIIITLVYVILEMFILTYQIQGYTVILWVTYITLNTLVLMAFI